MSCRRAGGRGDSGTLPPTIGTQVSCRCIDRVTPTVVANVDADDAFTSAWASGPFLIT